MPKVEWKPIKNYDGDYLISNLGNVISLKNGKRKELKQGKNTKGYPFVILTKKGKQTNKSVHRLVAEHFIHNIDDFPCVNHIDGHKENNIMDNLEWCTHLENNLHSIFHGKRHFKKCSNISSCKCIQCINRKELGGKIMNCSACEKELNRKEVMYTEDKGMYCTNPFNCDEDHPNSVTNIIARGAAVKMYTEEELEDNIFERLRITNEMKDRIIKVSTKPQSIRLSKYEIAYYLIALQEEMEMSSISEAVRYCVNLAMKTRPIGQGRKSVLVPVQPQGELTPEEIHVINASNGNAADLSSTAMRLTNKPVVIPDIPNSVNVNWNEVPVSVPVDDEEDEF